MKVFTCNKFRGFYPVGSAAVIVAESRLSAREQLEAELKRINLEQTVDLRDIEELYAIRPMVKILVDGDY